MARSSSLLKILYDGRIVRGSAPWFLAAFLAMNVLVAHMESEWNADRVASLLVPSTPSAARLGPVPRCDWSVGEDLGRYWNDIPDATVEPLVVVSGMSQMYAINDAGPGDEIIAELLD